MKLSFHKYRYVFVVASGNVPSPKSGNGTPTTQTFSLDLAWIALGLYYEANLIPHVLSGFSNYLFGAFSLT